jgi:hypothetical protein
MVRSLGSMYLSSPFRSRSFVLLAIGMYLLGCGGSEFSSGSEQNAGGAGGTQGGNAGSVSPADAASTSDTGSNGSGGTAQSHDGAAGTAGTVSGGMDARIICPPCAAPPNPACVGQGICGCGPYVCPEAGKDAAVEASGPTCGTAVCPVGKVCCNMLKGICTFPDMTCIQ